MCNNSDERSASEYHVMFDIDGTLILSDEMDGVCYRETAHEVLGHELDTDWTQYTHVSDAGILNQVIDQDGLQAQRTDIHAAFKNIFFKKISHQLKAHPVQQVPGASEFIEELRRQKNLRLSIATGCWLESAMMKLESANIDITNIPIASSSDHFARTEIMKIAREKAQGESNTPCTYFGDGAWDKQACAELGFNFVLVGEQISHHLQLPDFSNTEQATALIGR